MCFVIRPFDNYPKLVLDAVKTAAGHHQLAIDDIEGVAQRNFFDNIQTRITRAVVVIAICPPLPGTKDHYNANVMLELGSAYALGKPILLIHPEPQLLPANLRGDAVVKYVEGVDQCYEISSTLGRLLDRTKRRLIDNFDENDENQKKRGIRLATTSHRILLRPNFWDHLRVILEYVDDAENKHEGAHELLNEIQQRIDVVNREFQAKSEKFSESRRECVSSWKKFEGDYCQNIKDFYQNHIAQQADVSLACSKLIEMAKGQYEKEVMEEVQRAYDYISTKITLLKEQLMAVSDFVCLLDLYIRPSSYQQQSSLLPGKIKDLESCTTSVIDQCHVIVKNLLKLARG